MKILDGASQAEAPWPSEVTIDLGNTGYRLRSGHRLRIAISSSEFPRYLLHPGTTADPWTARDYSPAGQQLVVGGPRGARLRCFVLNASGDNT